MGQVVSAASTAATAAAGRPVVTTVNPGAAAYTSTLANGRPVVVTAAAAAAATATGLATYTNAGCYQDSTSSHILTGFTFTESDMTINLCETTCLSKGYSLAGVEAGDACYCGSTLRGCPATLSSTSCQTTCAGNSNSYCGGTNALEVYAVAGYSVISQCTGTSSTASSTSSTAVKTSTSSTAVKTSSSSSSTTMKTSTKASTTSSKASSTTASFSTYTGVAGASGANKVFAHFMIGNTYSMTSVSQYETEIAKAISMGIDGFACNIGSDTWQPNRLSLMYEAALSYPSFVLFVSLDMSVLADETFTYLYQFITPYTAHSSQYTISGKQFVSTFSGETYTGGQSDPATGWLYFKAQLAANGTDIYFVPSFTSYGAACLGWAALDGALSWNAWTKTTAEDAYYLQSRNNPSTYNNTAITTGYDSGSTAIYSGKTYMAGIGPLFFTHFNYKNYVYSNDDLYTVRWDNIVAEQPDFVEIISWNDYGESHYIGDIVGSLPYDSNGVQSSSWAYDPQFDHTPLGTLTKYYISAYKNNGTYPTVTTNSLFMWYRPHSINAVASDDPYGEPTCESATCPVDNIYLTVLLTGSATVAVTSAGSTQTFSGVAGKNYFQYVTFGTGAPTVTVTMSGTTILSETGTLAINNTIVTYNYNLHYDAWTF